jgi:hypothetical protein
MDLCTGILGIQTPEPLSVRLELGPLKFQRVHAVALGIPDH